ncbi:MAG: DUF3099 domain-containing protein [Actinomycetota bacterium]|nr:MAG: DUF3099 domain-containing protein [Actinomycetota bacterium]
MVTGRGSEHVYRITDARRGLSVEQAGRTRRYLVSMGIRTVCFLGAIITPGWPRWLLVLGAVCLPYLAVVMANGGRENEDAPPVGPLLPQPDPQLGPGTVGSGPAGGTSSTP